MNFQYIILNLRTEQVKSFQQAALIGAGIQQEW